MRQRKSKNISGQGNLRFITDISLRRKIENSIETTSFLYLKRNEKSTSSGFAKEIRRAEILYAASIIEAVLIHLFKRRGESMSKTDYKDVVTLPSIYQSGSHPVVVARQVQIPKLGRELTLDSLLELFSKNGIIKHRLKV